MTTAADHFNQLDPAEAERLDPVYFDMDGVLANFDEAYDRLIGERLPNGDVIWPRVHVIGDFFAQLRPMSGMIELWDCVPANQRRILSSIPKSIAVSGDHKRDWLKHHLHIDGESVILVRGKNLKKQYARSGHILIDDWPSNVQDWKDAGGTGILYVTHEQAISELRSALLQPHTNGTE